MSDNVNMSLEDSISKRKTTEPRGERGGFRGRRGRGGRRGDSDRPFRRGGKFDRKPFSKFGRGRFSRDGDRDRRDRSEKVNKKHNTFSLSFSVRRRKTC